MKALVTGASAGIGRAFATALAAEGFSVTAVARDADRLAQLVGELGSGHDHLAADLTTEQGVVLTSRANRLWTTAMRLLPRRTALTLLAD